MRRRQLVGHGLAVGMTDGQDWLVACSFSLQEMTAMHALGYVLDISIIFFCCNGIANSLQLFDLVDTINYPKATAPTTFEYMLKSLNKHRD